MPPPYSDFGVWKLLRPGAARASVPEFVSCGDKPIRAPDPIATLPLDSLPLLVISHDPHRGDLNVSELDKTTNEASEEMQEKLSRLSMKSTLVIAQKSGHYIQEDRPMSLSKQFVKYLVKPGKATM